MASKISEVMTERPRAVTARMTVREAARLMDEEDVGSLPVVDEAERLIGIVTDRDVAVRVVGRGLDSDKTVVGDVASTDVVALTPDHDLDDALRHAYRFVAGDPTSLKPYLLYRTYHG